MSDVSSDVMDMLDCSNDWLDVDELFWEVSHESYLWGDDADQDVATELVVLDVIDAFWNVTDAN